MKRLSPEKGYLLISSLGAWVTHLMGPYFTIWLKHVGLSFTQIGVVQSVSSFTTFITDFPTGGLADRYGRRLNYAFGLFLFSISLIIVAFSRSFTLIIFAAILAGLGSAFMSGTMVPWLYDSIGGNKKRAYNVFSKMRTMNGLLGTLAGLTAGFLSKYYLNLPLVLSGIFGLITSGLAILLLEENYGHHGDRNYWEILRKGIKHIYQNRTLHFLIVASFLISFSSRSFFMFWMLLAKNLGLKESNVGYIYPLLILSTSLGGFISIRLSKKTDHKKIAVASTVLVGMLITFMGLAQSLLQLLVFIIAFEVVLAIRMPALTTFRNEIIPSEGRSTIISALSTITNVFAMFANVIVGAVADYYSLQILYIFSGCLTIIGAIFVGTAVKTVHKTKQGQVALGYFKSI